MAVKENKSNQSHENLCPPYLNIVEYFKNESEKFRSTCNSRPAEIDLNPRRKCSTKDQQAEKAYICALLYQRSRSKGRESIDCWSSSSVRKSRRTQKDVYLDTEAEMHQYATQTYNDSSMKAFRESLHQRSQMKTDDVSRDTESFVLSPNMFAEIEEVIDNVLVFVDRDNDNDMMRLINNLRIETPIYTMPNKTVTATHIDDICGLGDIVTTNIWTISLLPNRQVRLEDEDHCYRIRLSKEPMFEEENVIVEGCLVPGGHLFRLEFALDISDKDKIEWLTIKDNRYICNEFVLDYMITHPFGSLESIRSTLRVANVRDPDEACIENKVIEMFECYYYQRHFYYKAISREFVGHLKIGKWGAKGHLNAVFFIPEGAQEENIDYYLMAMTSDVASFRALKATIYADFKDSGSHLKFDKKDMYPQTSLQVDYLSVCSLLRVEGTVEKKQFKVAKCVFDDATREFSSVNLEKKKMCIETHRIIAKPPTDEDDYDFRITGRSIETQDIIDLKVRVMIPENHQAWEDVLAIPFACAYAFLDLTLCELSERDEVICDIATDENCDDTYEQLKQFLDMLPNIEQMESCISYFSSSRIESLVLSTLDSFFHPLISLQEAKNLIQKKGNLANACGIERARIMQFIHRHIRGLFIDTMERLKYQSKMKIWCKLIPYYMRIDGKKHEQYQGLITAVANYFDEAPYGCPTQGPHSSFVSSLSM